MSQKKRRYTKNQQQELISRAQLNEHLIKQGWLPNPMIRDLGEDIVVQIYDDGHWSGLSLYLQLKSTTNLNNHKLSTEESISYPFETKDILHWGNSIVPVVLMIWDIEHRVGIWMLTPKIISNLDQDFLLWRENQQVSVRMPLVNSTDSIGLKHLRYEIASHSYPIASKSKSLDMQLNLHIPPTDKGHDFIEQMKQFYEKGGELTIPPEFIAELETSEWHQRLFGETPFSKNHPIKVSSRISETSTPTRIDIVARDGSSTSIPYVDFKVLRRGTAEFVLSNEHQKVPLHIKWLISTVQNPSLEVKIKGPGSNVQETKDALLFLKLMAISGSKIYVTPLADKKPIVLEQPLEPRGNEVEDDYLALIDKLCVIQQKSGVRLKLDDFTIDDQLARIIIELHTILTTGKVDLLDSEATPTFQKRTIQLALKGLQTGMGLSYSTSGAESKITILNTVIELGSANWNIVAAIPRLTEEELENILSEMVDDDQREIPVTILQGTAEFPKWKIS